jgi:hypothetical protein
MFDGSLDAAIGFDEDGDASVPSIWTGFMSSGNAIGVGDDTLGGNDAATDGCGAGDVSAINGQWALTGLLGGVGCAGANFGLYVLSPLLTVPTPHTGSASPQSW